MSSRESESGSETEVLLQASRDEWEAAKLPFKPNTTGFFLFTVFQFFDKPTRKEVGYSRALSQLLASTVLHITNFSVQFVLTFALLMFSVERQEDKFQQGDLLSAAPELTEAAASGVELANNARNQEVLALCHAEHHVPYTQSVILSLWCVKLLPPIIQSARFTFISLSHMPHMVAGTKSMVKMEGTKFMVVGMPCWLKVFVFLAANLPRVLLQIYLFYMGGEYLMFATSLNVLITKAVGLAFIKTMSELLFQGLASAKHQDRMKEVFLSFHQRPSLQWWDDWGASMVKLGFCIGCSVLFCRVHHGDVQNFRDACFKYHYAFDVPGYTYQGTTFLGLRLSN